MSINRAMKIKSGLEAYGKVNDEEDRHELTDQSLVFAFSYIRGFHPKERPQLPGISTYTLFVTRHASETDFFGEWTF
jgi:hypothetical protein